MKWLKVSGLMASLLVMAACGEKPAEQQPETSDAGTTQSQKKPLSILLRYKIDERGIDPYETSMVITNEFIRIDDDDNPRNFVLVDRQKEVVYSVSDENDAILVVNSMPVELEAPMEIKLGEQRVEEENVPRINGKPTTHYVFEANGKVCYQAVVAEGLLPEATDAITEYLEILAGQHASTLQNVPADQITACDLSMHILHPGRHLKHGLPIREWDNQSYRRQLIEFEEDYAVPAGIFELPADFGRFTIQDMQEDAKALAAPESGI